MHTLHELAYVRKVVTRSLPRFLFVYVTCRHVRTKRHAVIYELACAHKKRSEICGAKRFFGTRRTTSAASVSRMPKHIEGLGVNASKSCCDNIDLFELWPSRSPSCLLLLLPSFHTKCRRVLEVNVVVRQQTRLIERDCSSCREPDLQKKGGKKELQTLIAFEDTPVFRILRASGFFSRSKPETLKSRRPQREDWGIRGRKGRQGEEPSDKNAKFLIETTVD